MLSAGKFPMKILFRPIDFAFDYYSWLSCHVLKKTEHILYETEFTGLLHLFASLTVQNVKRRQT